LYGTSPYSSLSEQATKPIFRCVERVARLTHVVISHCLLIDQPTLLVLQETWFFQNSDFKDFKFQISRVVRICAGAISTIITLLKKLETRCAAITMLGKTVELCLQQVSSPVHPALWPAP
jgi:hypothetical protein